GPVGDRWTGVAEHLLRRPLDRTRRSRCDADRGLPRDQDPVLVEVDLVALLPTRVEQQLAGAVSDDEVEDAIAGEIMRRRARQHARMDQRRRRLDPAAPLEARQAVFPLPEVPQIGDIAVLGADEDVLPAIPVPIDHTGQVDAVIELERRSVRLAQEAGWLERSVVALTSHMEDVPELARDQGAPLPGEAA